MHNTLYRCNQGNLIEARCTPGLHWNKKVNRCDWPNNAKCELGEY